MVSMLLSKVFYLPARYGIVVTNIRDFLVKSDPAGVVGVVIMSVLISLASLNILGCIPGVNNPNMYYYFASGLSVRLWLCTMLLVVSTQLTSFMAHLLPYGTPIGLALILPVIELFSLLIRPFTLIVRLRTNLSAGHIIIFIFSYFAVAAKSFPSLSFLIGALIFLLYRLEVFVCLLQAYIFASLLTLYYKETL